ncbi:MAG: DoxX family protein [Desulfamplus sp.]|nr:DoxX family protein [Desulfamplus sp.]
MLTCVLRIIMGAVFLYASYDKILNPEAFAKAVYSYQILPDTLVNFVAISLPWLEFLLGFCLITGIWLPGTTIMITLLMTIFIGAMIFNMSRGLNIHCGCFSTDITQGPAGTGTVIRDIAFLMCSIYLTLRVLCFSEFKST